jgi:hypothetical protein
VDQGGAELSGVDRPRDRLDHRRPQSMGRR